MCNLGHYNSPLGKIFLASDSIGLVGAWFEDENIDLSNFIVIDDEFIVSAKIWLANYFSRVKNDVNVPLHIIGTDFQKDVWNVLLNIKYGETISYGDVATSLALVHKTNKMSARAVGNAIGKNHLAIFIPCHRVVGFDGKLTGYA